LLFCGYSGLRHTDDGLLFLVAGDKGDKGQQSQAQKFAQAGMISHIARIASAG
jgi:hypothetical protein